MQPVCIVTDSSVQFTKPNFPGRDVIRLIPFDIILGDEVFQEGIGAKPNCLPPSINPRQLPRLHIPDQDSLQSILLTFLQQFDQVIILTLSNSLCPLFQEIQTATLATKSQSRIHLIDSLTTGAGLGHLVQKAARWVLQGLPTSDIERNIRSQIAHIYTLFCPLSLSYLYNSGFLDRGQAMVGEMLNLYPIFTLEEGRLSPIEKQRNLRGTVEFFLEFLDEFEAIEHISLIQSCPPTNLESRILKQHIDEFFPDSGYSEHAINSPVAALLGPRTISLTVVEMMSG